MQITVEDQSAIKKTLHIEIPEETVSRELANTYKELKKNAKIKGFRAGKVPLSILKNHYKDQVHNDVTYQLIENSFPDAIKEKALNIIGEPVIDPAELKEDAPFTYHVTVEIKPEIDDINYKGLKLKKTLYTYSEEEITAQLDNLQNNFAEEKPPEPMRPARDGDIVIIDFEGFYEDKPFDQFPKSEKTKVELGKGFISDDFEAQLIGASAGETKNFSVTFADDYANENIAGKTIAFEVTVVEVKEKILPDLDDEFAKRLGPYDTMDKLKEEIAKNLKNGYDKRSEQELSEQVFDLLLEQGEFEVPETMVKHELDGIMEEIERTYAAYNLSMEMLGQDVEGLREKYRDTAVKQARRHIILNKLIEQEALTIDDDELAAGFQDVADSMNQPVDMIKQFYQQQPERIEVLRYSLLEKKAMSMVIESGQVEEVQPEKEDAGGEKDE